MNQGRKVQNKKEIKKNNKEAFVGINEETTGIGGEGVGGGKFNDVLDGGYARQIGEVLTWKRRTRVGQYAQAGSIS